MRLTSNKMNPGITQVTFNRRMADVPIRSDLLQPRLLYN